MNVKIGKSVPGYDYKNLVLQGLISPSIGTLISIYFYICLMSYADEAKEQSELEASLTSEKIETIT